MEPRYFLAQAAGVEPGMPLQDVQEAIGHYNRIEESDGCINYILAHLSLFAAEIGYFCRFVSRKSFVFSACISELACGADLLS